MGPKPIIPGSGELFRQTLREQINLKHPLVKLADLIEWERIDAVCASRFTSGRGRPATSPRLIAGLLYLQHAFDLSDDDVVWGWVENPYWQVFTGETYLQIEPPIDPEGFVVGARSMPGNPYDGHTLPEALEQASILGDTPIHTAVVDRGYRGVEGYRAPGYYDQASAEASPKA